MSSTVTALATLSRRLTKLSLHTSSRSIQSHACSNNNMTKMNFMASLSSISSSSSPPSSSLTTRQFSSENKDPDAEWNKFQKSLIYDPTINQNEGMTKNKRRGGKVTRKKKEKEMKLLDKQEGRMFDVGTGQFPPLRYADDETQKLLAEAYGALPPKGTSKKTRQKKRQKNRFKVIRKQRYVKKQERIAAHFAKMSKRSLLSKQVRGVIDGADDVKEREVAYQREVLKKFAMIQGLVNDDAGAESSEGEKQQEL